MAPVEPLEQRVAIKPQSRPSPLARQPDDTELRLMGVDEVAIDGEQSSDLCHGEEFARRTLQELYDAVRDGLDVLMLERHAHQARRAGRGGEIVLADEKPRIIEILRLVVEDTYVSQRLQTAVSSYIG